VNSPGFNPDFIPSNVRKECRELSSTMTLLKRNPCQLLNKSTCLTHYEAVTNYLTKIENDGMKEAIKEVTKMNGTIEVG
jgi:hypothetical protein